jgi:hypothetical protein
MDAHDPHLREPFLFGLESCPDQVSLATDQGILDIVTSRRDPEVFSHVYTNVGASIPEPELRRRLRGDGYRCHSSGITTRVPGQARNAESTFRKPERDADRHEAE